MVSKGAQTIKDLLISLFGIGVLIREEVSIPGGLRIDYYLPQYGIAVEFHGRQHAEFVQHFHKSAAEFRLSKKRDFAKAVWCKENGIVLIDAWDADLEDLPRLQDRILQAAQERPIAAPEVPLSCVKPEKRDECEERHRLRLEQASEARKRAYRIAKEKYKK